MFRGPEPDPPSDPEDEGPAARGLPQTWSQIRAFRWRIGDRAQAQWRRLIRKALRLRRLQRLFGHVGQHLQTFPSEIRRDLQRHFPKE